MVAALKGQVTLWDVLGISAPDEDVEEKTIKMPAIKAGQIVFIVTAGEVEKFVYTGDILGLGIKNYVIMNKQHKKMFQEKDYRRTAFFTRQEANTQAGKYWLTHPESIPKERINPLFTYKYIQKETGREAFFYVLPDGYVYVKDDNTFDYMVKFSSVEEAMEEGIPSMKREMRGYKKAKEECEKKESTFKNMYPCEQGCEWAYAEAGFQGIRG